MASTGHAIARGVTVLGCGLTGQFCLGFDRTLDPVVGALCAHDSQDGSGGREVGDRDLARGCSAWRCGPVLRRERDLSVLVLCAAAAGP